MYFLEGGNVKYIHFLNINLTNYFQEPIYAQSTFLKGIFTSTAPQMYRPPIKSSVSNGASCYLDLHSKIWLESFLHICRFIRGFCWLVDKKENCQFHGHWCTLAINHDQHRSSQPWKHTKGALTDLRWVQKKKPTSNIWKRLSWKISTLKNSARMNLSELLLLNLFIYSHNYIHFNFNPCLLWATISKLICVFDF